MALNVIFVTSEARPFATTGGLADVSGALPQALKAGGMQVTAFMPLYRTVFDSTKLKATGISFTVPVGKRNLKAELYKSTLAGVTYYFVKRDEYFDRKELYGNSDGDYFDNLERFAFFSRAVLSAVKALKLKPDIFHCNDWQTGLIPAYLKDEFSTAEEFKKTASVFTIHNLAYQGLFPASSFKKTGLSSAFYSISGLEFWGKMSLLKSGICFADIISTVSESYAAEIQTKQFGCGFEGLLKQRNKKLFGVLNGVDYNLWDPERDGELAANYSVDSISGKKDCKRALLKEFALKTGPGVPLIALVTRLVEQKGMDLVEEAALRLMNMDAALVLLGSGEKRYEDFFTGLQKRFPERCGVRIGFDSALSHRIEAGADIFLMPSKFEPCGLNQIYSLRYGTVPIVRATGGLNDTIRDNSTGDGNGYKFVEYTSGAMLGKIKEALKLYQNKRSWTALRKRGMRESFSWEASARSYEELYHKALAALPKIEAVKG